MTETKHRLHVFFLMFLTVIMISLTAHNAEAATNKISAAKSNTYTSGRIVKDRYGYRFKAANGKYVRNKWIYFKGSVYSLKANSYAKRGWFTEGGQTYYANTKGKVVYRKFLTIKGKTYYLHSSGKKLVNTWLKQGSSYYRFNKNGVLIRATMYKVGSKYYYSNRNGRMVKNTYVKIKGKKYYFGADGARTTAPAATTAVKVVDTKKHYLFVGDSRTVGMDYVVSDSAVSFIAKISMGYDWIMSTADSQIKTFLAKYPNTTVVFAFGVNDPANIDKYIGYYKQMMAKYPKVTFRFMSVNPINEAKYKVNFIGDLKNAMIYNFNQKLKAAVGTKFVNSYRYLWLNKFTTPDGVHYDAATNLKVYNYVMSQIKK